MAMARTTRATLVAIALAALVFGFAMLAHSAEQNDTEVVPVALDESDPERTRVGNLVYRGGLHIPRMGQNIGGLSALRWDKGTNKLVALADDGRRVWMVVDLEPMLTDMTFFGVDPLLGLDGEPVTGKEQGDSESLTRGEQGDWLVGFERDHRVWQYETLEGAPQATDYDVLELFGNLKDNGGLEAMASAPGVWIGCVERPASDGQPNCVRIEGEAQAQGFAVHPSQAIAELGGVPTDMDLAEDGTLYVLFRSWSRADGNGAAIVSYASDGTRRELATFRPPLTVDNFEGLAVREEGDRTFLYIVSDDNFSSSQRTLLMKFEVLPKSP